MTNDNGLKVTSISPKLKNAFNSVKKAIKHYLLIEFDRPDDSKEATLFIPALQQGIEALLAHWYNLQGVTNIPQGIKNKVVGYNPTYWAKDKNNESLPLRWLSHERNPIVHEGELNWNKPSNRKRMGQILLQFTGKLFLEIKGHLGFFNDLEINLLTGKEPYWGDVALANLDGAVRYFDTDVEIALLIAHETFKRALREFAESWGVPNTHSMALEEIKSALENDVYDLWENNIGVYYYLPTHRKDGNECHPERFWFQDTITISDISSRGSGQEKIRDFVDQVRFAVLRFIEDAPEPEFLSCFRENAQAGKIKSAWLALAPELQEIIHGQKENLEFKFSWRGEVLTIFLEPDPPEISEQHRALLAQVIQNLCGDKLQRHQLQIMLPVKLIF